ncbi:M20/M25/M40 family metallo-hydrolase [Erysipelothrix sp. D19-032]
MYPDTRAIVSEMLEQTLNASCELHGATYEFSFLPSYPPLINNQEMTALVRDSLSGYFGLDRVIEKEFPTLGLEDFAFLTLAVPASYYNVGINREGYDEPVHHHPKFAWDDEVLEVTSASLATVALDFLNQ